MSVDSYKVRHKRLSGILPLALASMNMHINGVISTLVLISTQSLLSQPISPLSCDVSIHFHSVMLLLDTTVLREMILMLNIYTVCIVTMPLLADAWQNEQVL